MKFVKISMKDGSVWIIPGQFVASNYADEVSDRKDDVAFKEASDFCLNRNKELISWAEQMHWSEVKHIARRIKDPDYVDYSKDWAEGTKTIISKELDELNK